MLWMRATTTVVASRPHYATFTYARFCTAEELALLAMALDEYKYWYGPQ